MMRDENVELGPWANCGACDVEIETPCDGVRVDGAVLCRHCASDRALLTGLKECDNCGVFRRDVESRNTPHGEGDFCGRCRNVSPECPECGDALMLAFGESESVSRVRNGKVESVKVHVEPWCCPACGHRE